MGFSWESQKDVHVITLWDVNESPFLSQIGKINPSINFNKTVKISDSYKNSNKKHITVKPIFPKKSFIFCSFSIFVFIRFKLFTENKMIT